MKRCSTLIIRAIQDRKTLGGEWWAEGFVTGWKLTLRLPRAPLLPELLAVPSTYARHMLSWDKIIFSHVHALFNGMGEGGDLASCPCVSRYYFSKCQATNSCSVNTCTDRGDFREKSRGKSALFRDALQYWWKWGTSPGAIWLISVDDFPYGSPHLCRRAWCHKWKIPWWGVLQRVLWYREQSKLLRSHWPSRWHRGRGWF